MGGRYLANLREAQGVVGSVGTLGYIPPLNPPPLRARKS